MNISSVIIRIKNDEKLKSTLQILNDFKGVEIVTHEKSKIIATIQSDKIDNQIAIFRAIEALENVEDVSMVFDYDDENFSQKDVSEILNNPKGAIKYSGDVNNKI